MVSIVDKTKTNECSEDKETLEIVAKRYYRNILHSAMEQYALSKSASGKSDLFGNISDSQLGQIDSIATQYKYKTEKAVKALQELLGHARKKSESSGVQKDVSDWGKIGELCDDLFGKEEKDKGIPLLEILSGGPKGKLDGKMGERLTANNLMGVERKDFFSEEDERRYKLELLVMTIRLYNKKKEAK
jgi:hypothetical protein